MKIEVIRNLPSAPRLGLNSMISKNKSRGFRKGEVGKGGTKGRGLHEAAAGNWRAYGYTSSISRPVSVEVSRQSAGSDCGLPIPAKELHQPRRFHVGALRAADSKCQGDTQSLPED